MENFRELQSRHYKATCKRGKIDKNTTHYQFIEAANNEDVEAIMAYYENDMKYSPEVVQEKIDAIAVRINELTHLNIDFIAEYEKNVIHQETRDN